MCNMYPVRVQYPKNILFIVCLSNAGVFFEHSLHGNTSEKLQKDFRSTKLHEKEYQINLNVFLSFTCSRRAELPTFFHER